MTSHKHLAKSSNKLVFGVCGGIADYFGWDATVVRIVWAVLTVFTAFAGVLIYLIFALVMPKTA